MRTAFFSVLAAAALLTAAPGAHKTAHAHGTNTADLAARVSPAVVNIFTEQASNVSAQLDSLPEGHPLRQFFDRFGGGAGRFGRNAEPQRSLGSGFIFDPQGFVITNHHVVDNAQSIKIRLNDEREFDARVIGSDEATDVALLKIESGGALPYVSFGDSSRLRVGEDVVAVGNPFGLGGTVTRGIVSAKGRNIGVGGPYVDYIQTDAAINQGNSGGPLFDTAGQVIGVNTAIFSPTGGSVGVGFAVPSNIVSRIVNDLRDDGNVERGWIGVAIQPVTDAIASALGMAETRGALIASVAPDGPSNNVLRPGDVLISFDNQPVNKSRDLPRYVGRTKPGASIPATILRDRVPQSIFLRIGTLPGEVVNSAAQPTVIAPVPEQSGMLGAELAAINPAENARYGLEANETGALVVGLSASGTARKSGLERGDVIQQVGDWAIASPDDVRNALAGTYAESVLLRIKRDGRTLYIGVPIKRV